jgi:hydroxymethylpyrimidine kinase/phosphomethylpyrimidine kinase
MRKALTIAGSDSGGGAGMQADLKTFAALGVYGMSALTAITAQNTVGVQGVHELPAEFVGLQIDSVVSDIGVDAVKTGMLANAEIIAVIAAKVKEHDLPNFVVDPVMVAKSGDPLLREDARDALIGRLLPLAVVVTPNLHEARVLTGLTIENIDDMKKAATAIHELGARHVVVKGGHLPGEEHSRHRLHICLGHCRWAGEGAARRASSGRGQRVHHCGPASFSGHRPRPRPYPSLRRAVRKGWDGELIGGFSANFDHLPFHLHCATICYGQ